MFKGKVGLFLLPLFVLVSSFALVTVSSNPVMADYIRTGPVSGPESTFIGVGRIGSGLHSVDAMEGKDGKLYGVPLRFSDVDEYKSGRCWVHVKSKGFWGVPNIISGVMNMFKASYYEKQKDGSYEKIDVDSLVFDCRKTN